MKDVVVRLCGIELINIKNVKHGKIELMGDYDYEESEMKSDILGIYGQNGSGKTAVIEVLEFLKILMSGASLPSQIQDFITKGTTEAQCKYSFRLIRLGVTFDCDYEFTIKYSEKCLYLSKERITYKNGIGESKRINLEYNSDNDDYFFTPQYQFSAFIQDDQSRHIETAVAKKLSLKECRSFFFSDDIVKMSKTAAIPDLFNILSVLKQYAHQNLFVIKNVRSGIINLNLAIPFSFRPANSRKEASSDLVISLTEPSVFSQEQFDLLKKIIDSINLVLQALIPDLNLMIKDYGQQMTEKGEEGIRFELLSQRKDKLIPLLYESEGIKKILSVLNLLITVYHLPGVCVAIDELDAGVYEYLLGELLEVLEKYGKGQLIFTSHNLRPLEMIHKSSLVFTTTNEENRYIRFANVKSNNNMRDVYLRSINLGGQKEEVYAQTSNFEISRAFRKAGGSDHA